MVELSVEIPTYNEAENIPVIVEKLESLGVDLEIIIIDDNSPDGTGDVAEKLKEKYSNLKVLRRPGKLGLATAIHDGLKLAEGSYIAVMDADMQHPPDSLPRLLEKAKEGNDLVIASRYVKEGGSEKFSIYRRIVSRAATFLAHAMLRETRNIKDPLSGFFVFRRDVMSPDKIDTSGYKILLEVLVKGTGKKVAEIPYTFKPRLKGSSKLGLRENMNYLRLILMLSEYRPLKFLTVGITGVIVNEGLLFLLHNLALFSYTLHNFPLTYAGAIAIEISIISNFVLNNFWTFSNLNPGRGLMKFLKYNLVAAPGAIINFLTLLNLAVVFHYLLANLIGIALAFLVNYLGSELFVWARS